MGPSLIFAGPGPTGQMEAHISYVHIFKNYKPSYTYVKFLSFYFDRYNFIIIWRARFKFRILGLS